MHDIEMASIRNQHAGLSMLFLYFVLNAARASKETLLHDKLLKTYNKNVRPVHRRNATINVVVHMWWPGFVMDEVNLLKATVWGHVWTEIRWKDDLLAWNASDYDDVDTVSVYSKDIWLPDITLGSSIKGQVFKLNPENVGRALVWSSGVVKIWPALYIGVGFDLFVYKYPFDMHECAIKITSWSYTSEQVSIKFSEGTEFNMGQANQGNGHWEIVNVRVENITLNDGKIFMDQAHYYFTLKRKWLYYILNIMAPVAVTSALNILCFALPSDSGERITLCISIYLTLAVFLNAVNNALPETSDELSILSIYIGLRYLASTFTILMTLITLKVYHKDGGFNFSLPCAKIVDKVKKYKFKSNSESVEDDNAIAIAEPPAMVFHVSWKRFSKMLDRLCPILLVVWNISLIIAFVVVGRSE